MKHAYLIMGHNNFETLKKLIGCLDDPHNDIYIHIDKKVKNWDTTQWAGKVLTKHSQVYCIERIKVGYLNYSQVKVVVALFSKATETYHDYYHILSTADLPIKSNNYIDSFFLANNGKEFIGFANSISKDSVCQRNYFLPLIRSRYKFIRSTSIWLRKLLIDLQKRVGYDLSKKYKGEIKKGADWYSITHAAASYLLVNEAEFRRLFYRAFCPSEFFAQTILFNSPFRSNLYSIDDENIGSQRYIDWERGQPYVYRKIDFDTIMGSPFLFARKFLETIDNEIIERIVDFIKKENSIDE